MSKLRVVSGMRPTGRLHLGHLVGALKNWAARFVPVDLISPDLAIYPVLVVLTAIALNWLLVYAYHRTKIRLRASG